MKILISIVLFFVSGQILLAGEGRVRIEAAWVRPVILQNRPGVAYFIIRNDANEADKLTGASSSLADRVEIHVTRNEHGVMKMMPVKEISVAAHSVVAVKPGGYHLMLFGLKKKLAPEDTLPLVLTFTHAGKIRVKAKVSKKAP